MHILIKDSSSSGLRERVAFLENEGFVLESQLAMDKTLQCLRLGKVQLLLMAAGREAASVIRQIRKESELPVMAVASCNDAEERLALYKHGIDDYIDKDIDQQETLYRVLALLRRNKVSFAADAPCRDQARTLTVDGLKLDRTTYEVSRAGLAVALTPLQFRLLWTMASHKDKVLSKPYLYRTLFNREYCSYDRGVDIHVSRVRKKLEQAGVASQRLATVHGRGYCFS